MRQKDKPKLAGSLPFFNIIVKPNPNSYKNINYCSVIVEKIICKFHAFFSIRLMISIFDNKMFKSFTG